MPSSRRRHGIMSIDPVELIGEPSSQRNEALSQKRESALESGAGKGVAPQKDCVTLSKTN